MVKDRKLSFNLLVPIGAKRAGAQANINASRYFQTSITILIKEGGKHEVSLGQKTIFR